MAAGIMNARTQTTTRRIALWNLVSAERITASGDSKAAIVYFIVIPLFDKFLPRLGSAAARFARSNVNTRIA
jgi:hypothetical protein